VAYASVAAFILMVAGLLGQLYSRTLFGHQPIAIAIQIGAAALMVWARMTFGMRSFHAAANPTAGGVVSSGPYAYWRHPIYSAVIYFLWAGAVDHRSVVAAGCAALATAGAILRMIFEERLLAGRYPEYRAYMARTRRVIPFLL
jgi:protein-S-isoprenylcysteine O-methyltransferase Ste14